MSSWQSCRDSVRAWVLTRKEITINHMADRIRRAMRIQKPRLLNRERNGKENMMKMNWGRRRLTRSMKKMGERPIAEEYKVEIPSSLLSADETQRQLAVIADNQRMSQGVKDFMTELLTKHVAIADSETTLNEALEEMKRLIEADEQNENRERTAIQETKQEILEMEKELEKLEMELEEDRKNRSIDRSKGTLFLKS